MFLVADREPQRVLIEPKRSTKASKWSAWGLSTSAGSIGDDNALTLKTELAGGGELIVYEGGEAPSIFCLDMVAGTVSSIKLPDETKVANMMLSDRDTWHVARSGCFGWGLAS